MFQITNSNDANIINGSNGESEEEDEAAKEKAQFNLASIEIGDEVSISATFFSTHNIFLVLRLMYWGHKIFQRSLIFEPLKKDIKYYKSGNFKRSSFELLPVIIVDKIVSRLA